MANKIREEFRLRNLRLSHPDFASFMVSKWMPVPLYLTYRWIVAIYISIDVLVDCVFFDRWYSTAFTFWGVISITLYFDLSAILCTVHYIATRRARSGTAAITIANTNLDSSDPQIQSLETENENVRVSPKCIRLYQLMWALYNISAVNSVIVSVGYWGFIHSKFGAWSLMGILGFVNVTSHLMNVVLMLLDSMIAPIPVRIFHLIYSNIYGAIYFLTTAFVWLASGKTKVFYAFLDYSNKPGLAVGVGFAGLFIVQPLLQLLFYGIFRARVCLQDRFMFSRGNGVAAEVNQNI